MTADPTPDIPVDSTLEPAHVYRHASGTTAVHVGPGLAGRVAELVPEVAVAGRVFVIVDRAVAATHGDMIRTSLAAAGIEVASAEVVATEGDKSPETITRLHSEMSIARVERRTPVIAVGGGITGDIAGFAAATWLRGVPVVQVPTTLLAMVDAAIGGKTGVNLRLPDGGLGKNLVGAFWQPLAVISDPRTLSTLPVREVRCGLAECLKHALIRDPGLAARIESDRAAILEADAEACARLVEDAAGVKIATVAADERESGVREQLNLGHTFGHAIEALAGDVFHHGEAVAVGLVAALEVGRGLGRLSDDDVVRATGWIESVGLPIALPAGTPVSGLDAAMRHDKKVRDGRLRLVVPGPIGACTVEDSVPAELVRDAWRVVGADLSR